MKRYLYLGKMRTLDEIVAIYESIEKSWEQHLQYHPKTVYPFRHSKVEALDKAAIAKVEQDKCKICGLPFHGLNYSDKCTCGT